MSRGGKLLAGINTIIAKVDSTLQPDSGSRAALLLIEGVVTLVMVLQLPSA